MTLLLGALVMVLQSVAKSKGVSDVFLMKITTVYSSKTTYTNIAHGWNYIHTKHICSLHYLKFSLDVDECINPLTCHGDATCTNSEGSFDCSCNSGFTGNGLSCEGSYI